MTDSRETAERLAAEKYPQDDDLAWHQQRAFIAGRTVSRSAYVDASRSTGISTYVAREFLRELDLIIEETP